MENQIIHAFRKSQTEEVRLSLTYYKGKAYLDLRVHFRAEGMQEFKPTKKGLTLDAEFAPELVKAFQANAFNEDGSLVATA